MFTGDVCGFGTPWIDHHHFAITCFDVFELLTHVGRSHDTAIRGQRVTADDEHILRAIHIRNRDAEHMAEQMHADDMVWQLVN